MPSYRDLRTWRSAHALATDVHAWCDGHWSPSRSASIDQLRRASLSVSLNIAEGYASGPGARCRHLLRVAHASAVETGVVLDLLQALGEPLGELPSRAERLAGMTYRLWARSRG